jgi:hypothetical protein
MFNEALGTITANEALGTNYGSYDMGTRGQQSEKNSSQWQINKQ